MITAGPREVLRFGVSALRRLGMRPTELHHLLPLSIATIKRYLTPAEPDAQAAHLSAAVCARPLSQMDRCVLTAFWVKQIAEGEPLKPPVPERAFLEVFCPTCVRDAPRQPTGDRLTLPPANSLHLSFTTALTIGMAACEAGVRPCVSSAARFAGVVLTLKVRPWDAAVFIMHRVAPDRWWLRTCSQCDRPLVTEHRSLRFCMACTARRKAAQGSL